MQSSACLSGHTIQHREKPFIQHSLPTPPSKLPGNSVWPEWTRWHGSTALAAPHTPLPSQPDSVCPSQLPPLSHSLHLPLLPKHLSFSISIRTSFVYFCMSILSPLSPFQSHAAATRSVGDFFHFFSTLLLLSSNPNSSLQPSFLFPHRPIHFTVDQSSLPRCK